jgi:hypothetical protein
MKKRSTFTGNKNAIQYIKQIKENLIKLDFNYDKFFKQLKKGI